MSNKEAQQNLIRLRLLDPPADGAWGQQSVAALREFQLENQLPVGGGLDELTKIELEKAIAPAINCGADLAGKICRYMINKDYWLPIGERRYSIVYVEGRYPDGTPNDDEPNEWNDSRFVIEVIGGQPQIVGAWSGTTEPGDHYVYHPINPAGAFRIKFGQYQAWQVGTHGNSEPHEALVQTG
ncbi:MAG: peptidoglycan-binding domain-containing protein, partial [Coleofasciculaceae cyanobacterium]